MLAVVSGEITLLSIVKKKKKRSKGETGKRQKDGKASLSRWLAGTATGTAVESYLLFLAFALKTLRHPWVIVKHLYDDLKSEEE